MGFVVLEAACLLGAAGQGQQLQVLTLKVGPRVSLCRRVLAHIEVTELSRVMRPRVGDTGGREGTDVTVFPVARTRPLH